MKITYLQQRNTELWGVGKKIYFSLLIVLPYSIAHNFVFCCQQLRFEGIQIWTPNCNPANMLLFSSCAAAVVKVARLSSENESSSQTNDCAHLRQQCLIDTNGCEQSWRSMEDTCIVPGKAQCIKSSSNHASVSVRRARRVPQDIVDDFSSLPGRQNRNSDTHRKVTTI